MYMDTHHIEYTQNSVYPQIPLIPVKPLNAKNPINPKL